MQSDLINFDKLPDSGFLRLSHMIPGVLPFSAATLWRKVRDGAFPPPVKLSDRITAWKVKDVRNWLDAHARQAAQPQEIGGKK